jgi:hypothetical protein
MRGSKLREPHCLQSMGTGMSNPHPPHGYLDKYFFRLQLSFEDGNS